MSVVRMTDREVQLFSAHVQACAICRDTDVLCADGARLMRPIARRMADRIDDLLMKAVYGV